MEKNNITRMELPLYYMRTTLVFLLFRSPHTIGQSNGKKKKLVTMIIPFVEPFFSAFFLLISLLYRGIQQTYKEESRSCINIDVEKFLSIFVLLMMEPILLNGDTNATVNGNDPR